MAYRKDALKTVSKRTVKKEEDNKEKEQKKSSQASVQKNTKSIWDGLKTGSFSKTYSAEGTGSGSQPVANLDMSKWNSKGAAEALPRYEAAYKLSQASKERGYQQGAQQIANRNKYLIGRQTGTGKKNNNRANIRDTVLDYTEFTTKRNQGVFDGETDVRSHSNSRLSLDPGFWEEEGKKDQAEVDRLNALVNPKGGWQPNYEKLQGLYYNPKLEADIQNEQNIIDWAPGSSYYTEDDVKKARERLAAYQYQKQNNANAKNIAAHNWGDPKIQYTKTNGAWNVDNLIESGYDAINGKGAYKQRTAGMTAEEKNTLDDTIREAILDIEPAETRYGKDLASAQSKLRFTQSQKEKAEKEIANRQKLAEVEAKSGAQMQRERELEEVENRMAIAEQLGNTNTPEYQNLKNRQRYLRSVAALKAMQEDEKWNRRWAEDPYASVDFRQDLIPEPDEGLDSTGHYYINPQGTDAQKAYFWVNHQSYIRNDGSMFYGRDNEAWETEDMRDPRNVHEEQFMTSEMRRKFNEYYGDGTQDEQMNALAYLEALRPMLRYMRASYQADWDREKASGNLGWLYGAATVPKNLSAGVVGVGRVAASMLGNEAARDPNSSWGDLSRSVATTREERGDVWENTFQGGKFLNQVVYSMADNIAAMAATMGVSSLAGIPAASNASKNILQFIMSSEAMASTFQQELENDTDPTKAAIMSIADGVFEWYTENMGWDALMNANVKDMLGNRKDIMKYIAKNFGAEAGEEVSSGAMQWVFGNIYNAIEGHATEDEETIDRLVNVDGMDIREAEKQVFMGHIRDLAMEGLAGGLSGGVMGGGNVVKNSVSQTMIGNRAKEDMANVKKLVKAAGGMNEGTNSKAQAEAIQEKLDKGKKPTNYELGKLMQNISEETGAEVANVARGVISDVAATQLQERGMEGSEAREVADIIAEVVQEGDLSKIKRSQRDVLTRKKGALEVLRSFFSNLETVQETEKEIAKATSEHAERMQILQRTMEGKAGTQAGRKDIDVDVSRAIRRSVTASEAEMRAAGIDGKSAGALDVIVDGAKAELVSIAGDKATVVLGGNKEEVSIGDLKAANKGVAAVVDFTTRNKSLLSDAAANIALKGIRQNKRIDAATYLGDAVKIYGEAMALGALPKTKIDTKTAQEIFNQAKQEFAEQEAKRVLNQKKVKPGRGSAKVGDVAYGTDGWKQAVSGWTKQQRNQAGAVAEIAVRYGANVSFINDEEHSTTYGWENAKDGSIVINVAAKAEDGSPRHMLTVFAHELTHWLEQNSQDGYANLRQYIVDRMRKNGEDVADFMRQTMNERNAAMSMEEKEKGTQLSYADAMAELVANASDQIFRSEKLIQDLQKTNPSLFDKAKQFVKNFVARMNEAIKGMKDSTTRESRALKDDVDAIAMRWLYAKNEAMNRKEGGAEATGEQKSMAQLEDRQAAAVIRGDTEAAHRLVEQYARRKGYTDKGFHGTNGFGFTKFDLEGSQGAIFIAYDQDLARTYTESDEIREIAQGGMDKASPQELAEILNRQEDAMYFLGLKEEGEGTANIEYNEKTGLIDIYERVYDDWDFDTTGHYELAASVTKEEALQGVKEQYDYILEESHYPVGMAGIYQLYAKPGKQLVVDAKGAKWNDIKVEDVAGAKRSDFTLEDGMNLKTREVAAWAKEHGYDSVRINNVLDSGEYQNETSGSPHDIGIFFKESDVKSADNVTYDDEGNPISLEERFSDGSDIRWSKAQANKDTSDWKTYTQRNGVWYSRDGKGNTVKLEGADAEYVKAWNKGDYARMEELLADKIRENGAIPFKAAVSYNQPDHMYIAKAIKRGDMQAVRTAAQHMAELVPDNAVLVPMPNHMGVADDSTDTMILAKEISRLTGRPVVAALEGVERESRQEDKKKPKSKQMKAEDLGFRQAADIPEGMVPYIVDNVIASGLTAEAAHKALGNNGVTLAYAKSTQSANDGLKRANVTFYDTNKQYGQYLIPLSERIDMEKTGYNGVKFSQAQKKDTRQTELWNVVENAQNARNDISEKYRALTKGQEASDLMDKVHNAQTREERRAAMQEYNEWAEKNDIAGLKDRLYEAEEAAKKAQKEYDAYLLERDRAEEQEKIKASGLEESEWRRKEAVKQFGLTTNFREAGYLLPNGKMLNFSGEKGVHNGHRYEDHRSIGFVYADKQGSEAMNAFMAGGNIRVMAETPGIDISTKAEPTAEQYAQIRNMANRFAGEEFFSVDFSDERGNHIDNIEYDGRVNGTKVVNDIKSFFKNGQAPEQSVVSQFHYAMAQATANPVKNFTGDAPIEMREDGLIAVHNLSERGLMEDLKMNGFPMPSIAIMKSSETWRDYGEISVFFGRDTVDPQRAGNRIYGGDAMTPALGNADVQTAEEAMDVLRSKPERNYNYSDSLYTAFKNFKKAKDIETVRQRAYFTNESLEARMERTYKLDEMEQGIWEKLKTAAGEQTGMTVSQWRSYGMENLIARGIVEAAEEIEREEAQRELEEWEKPYIIQQNVQRILKEEGAPVFEVGWNGDEMDAILEYIDYIQGNTGNWMQEAKPDRVVALEEIQAVVLPETVSQELIGGLMEAGIGPEQIYFYNPMSSTARARKLLQIPKTVDGVLFSQAQSDMNVNQWMLGLDPKNLATEQERNLLKQYKEKRIAADIDRMAMTEQRAAIRRLEQKDKLTAFDKNELQKAYNRLQNWQNKLDRDENDLARITSTEGYAGLMYRQQKLMNNLVNGRTADEVQATVEAIQRKMQDVEKEMEEGKERLEKLAGAEGVVAAKTYFAGKGLRETAQRLKKNNLSSLNLTEIENRLASIALRLNQNGYNAEEVWDDITTLAQMLADKTKGAGEQSYILQELRGSTFYLSKTQMKELTNTHRTLRDVNKELAGTGIRIREGKAGNTTLDQVYDQYRETVPSLHDVADTEMLDELLDVVKREKASEQANLVNSNMGEVIQNVFEEAVTLAPTKDAGAGNKAQIDTLIKYISELSAEAREQAKTVDALQQAVKRMQREASEAKGKARRLDLDVADAIKYFNTLTEQSEAVIWRGERAKLIAQLKDEKTKELIAEQQKWKDKIEKDKTVRTMIEDNRRIRNQITVNVNRLRKLLEAETDQKNVPEHMKGLAWEMLRLIADNDLRDHRRKISQTEKKALLRTKEVMDFWFGDNGSFSVNDIRDEQIREVVEDALADISDGIGFYNAKMGKDVQANVQAMKNALERIRSGVVTVMGVITAESSAIIGDRRVAVQDAADDVKRDLDRSRFKGEYTGKTRQARETIDSLVLHGNMTPVYFFKNLMNRGMNTLWHEIEEGENKNGLLVARAKEFMDQVAEDAGYSTWDMKKKYLVTLSGEDVRMTLEQLMSLYATWKREKTVGPEMSDHLKRGGVYIEENDMDKGIAGRAKATARAHRVTDEDMQIVEALLTDKQREYVDKVVGYMSSEMSELGNETSLKMYGVKKYNEKYYFPMQVWNGVKNQRIDDGSAGTDQNKVAHMNWSKRRKNRARNAIVIGNFTELATKHIVEMINYNTMAPAIENINKVMNVQYDEGYGDTETRRNLRVIFEETYGKQAAKYMSDFMRDLNGGVKQDSRKTFSEVALRVFKKNAVAGSLSVAMQQPLSYIRAAVLLNPKYLAKGLMTQYWKGSYAERMKYSGVSVIKDMGPFDVALGRSAREYIQPEQKRSAARKTMDFISDYSTILPELGDRWTWNRMWVAVKAEQHDLHPDMDVKSDEFLTMVGKRFNELMRKTQVYDSALSKSSNMRSQNGWMKAATSFMAEPTLSLNVLADAILNRKEKGGKMHIVRATALFAISAAAQAAIKALMSTGRTPDEKKTWEENFMYRFWQNMMNEVDPLQSIPMYSDLISILKGEDVADDALTVLTKIQKSIVTASNLIKGKTDVYRGLEDSAAQIAQLFSGVPAKNIMRDMRAAYNWFLNPEAYASRASSGAVMKYQAIDTLVNADNLIGVINKSLTDAGDGYKTSTTAYYGRIFEAEKNKNSQKAADIKEYLMLGKGAKEKSVISGIRSAAKADKDMTSEQKAEIVAKYSGKKPNEEWFAMDKEDYENAGGTQTSSTYYRLEDAMEANKAEDIQKAVKELLDHGITTDKIKGQLSERRKKYLAADNAGKTKIRDAMQKAYKAIGKTAKDADKTIENWVKSAANEAKNEAKEAAKEQLKSGKLSVEKFAKQLQKENPGMTDNDAWFEADRTKYEAETGKKPQGSKYYRIYDAIDNGKTGSLKRLWQDIFDHGASKKESTIVSTVWEHYDDQYMTASKTEQARLKNMMIIALQEAGVKNPQQKIEKKIKSYKSGK